MTAAPGPADSSVDSSKLFSHEGGRDVPTTAAPPKSPSAQLPEAWIQTLPKRVRVRRQEKQSPDPHLNKFLSLRPRLESSETAQQLRRQYAGHWQDISVLENSVDGNQLTEQLTRLSQDNATVVSTNEINWNWRRDWLGLFFSLLLHFGALTLLLIWALPTEYGDGPIALNGEIDGIDLRALTADTSLSTDSIQIETTAEINRDIPIPFQPKIATVATKNPTVSTETSLADINLATSMSPTGGGISGRAANKRSALVQEMGGNQASEEAVDRGLRWIANHQEDDGGWRFSHKCDCGNPGHCYSRTAATGLALLTFLARNHNHVEDSQYKEVVLNGLNFLILAAEKGDLTERTRFGMYGQGMATLALAEAFAISKDPTLKRPAQEAVDFIVSAQHPAGGWRYTPQEIGDLNVTGWQLMALKTAKLAGLNVPEETLVNAKHFVDSQAISNGSKFIYPDMDKDTGQPVPTAIGILLRMYEGWGPERDEISLGVSYLGGKNISPNHIYFNYYATMVMFHYGGDRWTNWNRQMRDFLINSQDIRGHERGSWFFPHGKTGAEGGRLMNTTMSVLILEVYYRHLRLYDEEALTRDFPLD